MAFVFSAQVLLDWFSRSSRKLPWRIHYDPYHVWISEVMLQQTRVEQMLPYFGRFLNRFPSVHFLAEASEEDVLKYWEGLGYYSRARNLHAAAKKIVLDYSGELPSDYEKLLELQGFGPYIAAAVASIGFNLDFAVVDGNVFRVLARFYGIEDDIRDPKNRKKFQSIADSILPTGKARLFNQAVMELGALVCVPEKPLCGQCPIRSSCVAFLEHRQLELPVSSKKPRRPTKTFAAIRVKNREGVWLVCHQTKLLKGLYSFPLVEFDPLSDSKESIEQKFAKSLGVRIKISSEIGRVHHEYTHFKQLAVLFDADLELESKVPVFFSESDLVKFPLTKLQHKLMVL